MAVEVAGFFDYIDDFIDYRKDIYLASDQTLGFSPLKSRGSPKSTNIVEVALDISTQLPPTSLAPR